MDVKSAQYGHFNDGGRFFQIANRQCNELVDCRVKTLCGGNRCCELTMDNHLLPSEYCSDSSKQIYTKYICVDQYTSSAITEGNA